jgi:hypothetical protein
MARANALAIFLGTFLSTGFCEYGTAECIRGLSGSVFELRIRARPSAVPFMIIDVKTRFSACGRTAAKSRLISALLTARLQSRALIRIKSDAPRFDFLLHGKF